LGKGRRNVGKAQIKVAKKSQNLSFLDDQAKHIAMFAKRADFYFRYLCSPALMFAPASW